MTPAYGGLCALAGLALGYAVHAGLISGLFEGFICGLALGLVCIISGMWIEGR